MSAHEMVDKNVTRERGGDTVVSFEKFEASTHAQTIRRSGVEMSDLAKSPLISGSNDPDSQGYKYKRRSAADWLLRFELNILSMTHNCTNLHLFMVTLSFFL